jgi:hypothetical protein
MYDDAFIAAVLQSPLLLLLLLLGIDDGWIFELLTLEQQRQHENSILHAAKKANEDLWNILDLKFLKRNA